ncbi:MAG: hypothetical protein VCC04_14570, partial [Myxococcota bacterium]
MPPLDGIRGRLHQGRRASRHVVLVLGLLAWVLAAGAAGAEEQVAPTASIPEEASSDESASSEDSNTEGSSAELARQEESPAPAPSSEGLPEDLD